MLIQQDPLQPLHPLQPFHHFHRIDIGIEQGFLGLEKHTADGVRIIVAANLLIGR
jgi:hypothetical protein